MEANRLTPAIVIMTAIFVLGTASAYFATDASTGEETGETQVIQMQNKVSELDCQVRKLEYGYEDLHDQIISLQADLSGATDGLRSRNGMGVVLVLGGLALGVGMAMVVKRK